MTLDDYADAVVNEVRRIAAPTILVGHSMGGQAQLIIIVILGSVRSLK
jgi:predicted alpha/beta hydrolase family esterase